MGGGPKIPYPKHVWSPAGGWYAQPANWRSNTLAAGGLILSVVFFAFNLSSEREEWLNPAPPSAFAPSRNWSKSLRQPPEPEGKGKSEISGM